MLLAAAPAAAAGGGTLTAYVSDEAGGRLVAVEPISGRHVASVRVAPGPHNVAASPDGRLVLVTSPGAGRLTVLRASPLRVVRVIGGFGYPHDVEVSPDSRWAYVTDERRGEVAVVSLTRYRVVRRVRVGPRPHDLAVRPDGRRVWVTHGPRQSRMTILDTRRPSKAWLRGRVAARAGSPHDISFGASRVWVTYWGSGRVGAYDPRDGRLLVVRSAGSLTHHVLAANRRAWVTDHHGARAIVYTDAGRRLRTLRTCDDPHHVAVHVGVAVVACVDGRIVAFREESGATIRTTRVGAHLHGVALVFE